MSSSSARKRVNEEYEKLFETFCDSSTIHGTYFWSESKSTAGKSIWVFIVFLGIGASAYVINRSFLAWKENPVITSVVQIPIEQVPFPSVTICPLDSTGFGYVEHLVNERQLSNAEKGRALAESMLMMLANNSPLQGDHCLLAACTEDGMMSPEDCSPLEGFRVFRDKFESLSNYSHHIRDEIVSRLPRNLRPGDPFILEFSTIAENPECQKMVADFLLLNAQAEVMKEVRSEELRVGSILNLLYSNLELEQEKESMFRSFIDPQTYPELYSSSLGTYASHHLPKLVDMLTKRQKKKPGVRGEESLQHLHFAPELLELMRLSIHPPHVAETFGGDDLKVVPNPAFPFCYYQDRQGDGIRYGPYKEYYCNDFQTTVNEKGLCYTYNNVYLGLDPAIENEGLLVRNVKGCGKSKGLQLIVDSQKLRSKPDHQDLDRHKGFEVYITVPGVITHKVKYIVDSSFYGEHHFHLHGIHYIDSSPIFKVWNADARVCYFPQDKEMRYFASYTQDNCLLECKYQKIASLCGCYPWYLNQTDLPICGMEGNACFEDMFSNYQEELQDRVDCDCKSDCEGIHFFASMNRHPFTDSTATDHAFWWDEKTKSGRLANYLMDPMHVFSDPTVRKLNKLKLNITTDSEWASHRFRNDISVLNFFFDTPIITRITLEMRINVFDQISAIGGTLGLFTGVSLITFAEVAYWCARFILASLKRAGAADQMTDVKAVEPVNLGNRELGSRYKKDYGRDYLNVFN